MAPLKTPQEGAQGGRRFHHTTQDMIGTARTQRISVVDAVSPSQCRGHQRQHLVASVGSPRGPAQVNMVVYQLTQSQMMGQRDRQDQPSIGHQTVIIEGDMDAVRIAAW